MARTNQTARKQAASKSAIKGKAPRAGKKGLFVAKTPKNAPDVKRPHRFRPGTVALREIRKFQKSTEWLIPKAPFERLVRECAGEWSDHLRFTKSAVAAFHEGAEAYLIQLFEELNHCAIHTRRVTVMPKDFYLRIRIKAPYDKASAFYMSEKQRTKADGWVPRVEKKVVRKRKAKEPAPKEVATTSEK